MVELRRGHNLSSIKFHFDNNFYLNDTNHVEVKLVVQTNTAGEPCQVLYICGMQFVVFVKSVAERSICVK